MFRQKVLLWTMSTGLSDRFCLFAYYLIITLISTLT